MSIETEKWVYDYDADEIQDVHGRAVLEACEPGTQRREQVYEAAQVLPEALALLKEMLEGDGAEGPSTRLSAVDRASTQAILRRAGVLK